MKLKEVPSPIADCKAFRTSNNLIVICGREQCGPNGEMRWHLSVSHHHRYPHWDEIKSLRYLLVPSDLTMVMFLPPRREYVNVHANCFHLYEIVEGETPQLGHFSAAV